MITPGLYSCPPSSHTVSLKIWPAGPQTGTMSTSLPRWTKWPAQAQQFSFHLYSFIIFIIKAYGGIMDKMRLVINCKKAQIGDLDSMTANGWTLRLWFSRRIVVLSVLSSWRRSKRPSLSVRAFSSWPCNCSVRSVIRLKEHTRMVCINSELWFALSYKGHKSPLTCSTMWSPSLAVLFPSSLLCGDCSSSLRLTQHLPTVLPVKIILSFYIIFYIIYWHGKRHKIYTNIQKFGVYNFFCSQRLHLFDSKCSKNNYIIVKYY